MGGKNITEKVIGSLVGVSGHTFDMEYDLFFTTERMIAVSIRHPADVSQPPSLWQSVFLGSFWSSGREKLKRDRNIQKKRHSLQDMAPDELVGDNSRNFVIPYSEIASVEIKRRFVQSQLRFHVSGPSNTERVVSFNISKKQVPEAERLLKLTSLSEPKQHP